MRRTICVPYSGDLIETALREVADPCIFVFPTKISAAKARQRWLANWHLEDCEFFSMEELKQNLLLPPGTVVRDDARLLCLYQALNEADRDYFHINSYFDTVDWGNHFFQLCEELCDELIEIGELRDPSGRVDLNLMSWQDEYLDKILAVHARYRDLLGSQGLTDPIFYVRPESVRNPYGGSRFVFVNQYYYSKLEKALLQILEDAGSELVVISQATCTEIDAIRLPVPTLRLDKLEQDDVRTAQIEVVECENAEQTVLHFLANHSLQPVPEGSVIVDARFAQAPYREWFDPARFQIGSSVSLVNSGLYWFLQTLHKHLEALGVTLEGRFLPLRMVLDACSNEVFLRYYQPAWQVEERQALRSELRFLLDRDILYVDTRLDLLSRFPRHGDFPFLRSLLQQHFALLGHLAEVRGPQGLVDLIDAEGGLRIQAICGADELAYSNILEQFYERLANFASLESLGAVASWQGLFGREGVELAASVLRLFLESLASARLRFARTGSAEPAWEISNLLDLRNLSYGRVVFFHAIEGEIPSNPSPAWLFNEAQRARLGLKSYSELRERERYYFFRLILNSRETVIYTYRNQEKDIEPGSFVTELQHEASRRGLKEDVFFNNQAAPLNSTYFKGRNVAYGKMLPTLPGLLDSTFCWVEKVDQDSFFALPPDPGRDFGADRAVKASFSSLSWLTRNSFVWYLEYLRRLRETELRPQETVTRKLFGTIMHDFLARVLRKLEAEQQDLAGLERIFDAGEELSATLQSLLTDPLSLYLYKLPQNYNQRFLQGIISDSVVGSIQKFYANFLRPMLAGDSFRLIPEEEYADSSALARELVTLEQSGQIYRLLLNGRADLRIETPGRDFIVDFKTGSFDDDQLIFYEWLYYLLDPDYDGKPLSSLFWLIFDQRRDGKSPTPEARDKLLGKVSAAFTACLETGFTLGRSAADRAELAQITRADLYRVQPGGDK